MSNDFQNKSKILHWSKLIKMYIEIRYIYCLNPCNNTQEPYNRAPYTWYTDRHICHTYTGYTILDPPSLDWTLWGFPTQLIEDPSGWRLMRYTRACAAASGWCSRNPHGFWWRRLPQLAPFPWLPASDSGRSQPTSPWLPDLPWNLKIPRMQCQRFHKNCLFSYATEQKCEKLIENLNCKIKHWSNIVKFHPL